MEIHQFNYVINMYIQSIISFGLIMIPDFVSDLIAPSLNK